MMYLPFRSQRTHKLVISTGAQRSHSVTSDPGAV